MRQTNVPFEVVKALLDNQNSFNEKLVQLLGEYLEKAAMSYRDALNPPVESSPSVEMSYSSLTDEEDDLMHQIETGQIPLDKVPDSLRRLIADTDFSIDPT